MATRSVPAGSSVSVCQATVVTVPHTSRSVWIISASALEPGNTTTVARMGALRRSTLVLELHLRAAQAQLPVLQHHLGRYERELAPHPQDRVELARARLP